MFCSNCGSKIADTDRFCRTCGATVDSNPGFSGQPVNRPVNQPASQPVNQYQGYSAPVYGQVPNQYPGVNTRTGNKKTIIIIAAAALVVVVGVVLVLLLSGGGRPVDTVNRFVDSINKRDFSAMVACVDPVAADSMGLSSFTEIARSDVKISITRIISEKVDGDDAVVIADTAISQKDDSGKTQTEKEAAEFTLKKIEGKWKITDIDSSN